MSADQTLRGVAAPKLREGRAPVRDRLMAMLFLTALLHAIVILGVSFNSTGFGNAQAPQLDVLLVTDQLPEARDNPHATYLAQRTQLGAGDTDAHVPPGSPASQGARTAASAGPADASSAAQRERRDALDRERVLASTGASPDIRYFGEVSTPPEASAEPLGQQLGPARTGRGDAVELLLRGRANRDRWVSPDTRASQLAPYLAEWKRKVERVGTLNFPSAARRTGLSGSPVVEVEITANGELRGAHVQRSSGYGALDEAALTILRLASPFSPFPPALAARYARLRFAYQWDFVAGSLATSADATTSVPVAAPPTAGTPPTP